MSKSHIKLDTEQQKEIYERFRYLSDRYGRWEVWVDFITLSACSLCLSDRQKREAEYASIVKRYRPEEMQKFAEMFALTIEALELNPNQDFLGELFMRLDLSNTWKGQFFTPSQMTKFFGGEKGLPIINRACKWAVAAPERYALLQCFAGIDSATMFSSVQVEDRLEARLKELQKSSITYTKKQVMEQLQVTASQLDILTRKYNLQPFWRQIGGEQGRVHKLGLALDDKEYEIYRAAFERSGYRYDRHFIRHCVMEYIKKTEGGRST